MICLFETLALPLFSDDSFRWLLTVFLGDLFTSQIFAGFFNSLE